MRAALYTRVSTAGQTPENQTLALEQYAAARGWTVTASYCDHGISGAKERRPQLDALMADARRRRFDVVLVWKLDRFGRNLKHLIAAIEELTAVGVQFASLNEAIDTGTPSGRLMLHLLGSFAQFERDRIAERVSAGLQRARTAGRRLGRPRKTHRALRVTVRAAAAAWSVSRATAARRLNRGELPPETIPRVEAPAFAPTLPASPTNAVGVKQTSDCL